MLKNYKIKVNNEAESKEAQELITSIGCTAVAFSKKLPKHILTLNPSDIDSVASVYSILPSLSIQELTIPQLRDLVAAHRKPTEQGLISGADALRALADGKEVQCTITGKDEWTKDIYSIQPYYFVGGGVGQFQFRLKPRTIKIELEIPACGKKYKHGQLIWILNSLEPNEYCSVILDESDELPAYWWETESEIKQVVAALRGAICKK